MHDPAVTAEPCDQPASRGTGSVWMHRAPVQGTTNITIDDLARSAADALRLALADETAARDEVGTSKRAARDILAFDRRLASVAIQRMVPAAPVSRRLELADMAEGALAGFAVERWTLRLMQIAAEVSEVGGG